MMPRAQSTTASTPEPDRQFRNVVALGWVAFFGGLAQDMIQPILPVFYASALGLSKEFIGLIEGALVSVISLMKIAAGYLSDALGQRKPLVFVGYALSAISRFGLGFAGSGAAVFALRLGDGVGKGVKDAPRDALVAGSAGGRKLGYAFGVQRTLDTLGSVAGPVLVFWLLRVWLDHPNRYREVFWVAGLIAAIPLLLIGLFVTERSVAVAKQRLSLTVLKGPFAGLLAVMLLFTHRDSCRTARRSRRTPEDDRGRLGRLCVDLSRLRTRIDPRDDLAALRVLRPVLRADGRLEQGARGRASAQRHARAGLRTLQRRGRRHGVTGKSHRWGPLGSDLAGRSIRFRSDLGDSRAHRTRIRASHGDPRGCVTIQSHFPRAGT
jgi:Major Facilitator Superfamily